MILIRYKDLAGQEKVIKFIMKSLEEEKRIVDRFILGNTRPTEILNLGQKGKIPVKDIIDMKQLANTETFHKNEVIDNLLGGFGNSIFGKGWR